jgi:hypothetical protein
MATKSEILEQKGLEYCGIATKAEVKKISKYGAVETVAAPKYKYKVYMQPGNVADQANRFLSYGNFDRFFKGIPKL